MKKKITQVIMAFVLVAGTAFVAPQAHAQTPTPTVHVGFFQGLMQFIEQKFGLDKTQVQSAVKEYKQDRKASITPRPTMSPQDRQANQQKRLDGLVTAGKITADQEKAILAELDTVWSKYNPESLKGLTPEQRKAQMDAMRNEIVSWAKVQGIDSSYVLPGFGMMRGPGGQKGWGQGRFGGKH